MSYDLLAFLSLGLHWAHQQCHWARFRAPALPPVGRWEKGAPVLPEERARTKPSAPFSGHCVSAHHKALKVLEERASYSRLPSFHRGLSARPFIAGSSRQTSALGTELARPSALLAVAVLRTVRHVLRIGRDVRSILVGLLHRRRRSSNHGVTLE